MTTIRVFNEEQNKYYQVDVSLFSAVMDRVNNLPSNGDIDYYLKITTTMKYPDGTSFGEYVIRNLSDVPTGYSAATTFTQLVNDYIEYFQVQATLGQSSSSSSSSSTSSSSSSSSSSSEGYSSSSYSSNSSSSKSLSSSSSEGYSSLSSSSSQSQAPIDGTN